jgi:hypothetical protein
MKALLTLLFSLFILSFEAQMHEKTGKNIGLSLYGGLNYTSVKESAIKFKPNHFYGAGITRSFGDIIFPEINYTYGKGNYGLNDSLAEEFINANHSLGLSLNSKLNIFRFSMGKSNKGECTWLNVKLLLGLNYSFHFQNKANFPMSHKNDFFLESGIGILPKYSGGHKSRVAWSYYFDLVFRYDATKNTSFMVNEVTGFRNNALMLRLTIVNYRTYDFLGGNQKKKSYNKKY